MPPRRQRVKVKSSKTFNNDTREAEYSGPATRSRGPVQRSPIFKLPLEVLGMIFILILPSDLELGEEWRLPLSQQRLEGRSSLLLCAVCSLWRTLALATPQLWRQIFIHIPHDMSKAVACSKADRLLQWIQRSGSLPLALYISSEGFFGYAWKSIRRGPVISVLHRHASRCGALYLQKPSNNVLLKIFKFERSRPKLRNPLRRRDRYPNTMPQENQLVSWSQLTHLQIRRFISAQQSLVIFKACSKLVWLSINIDMSHWQNMHKPPIILHDLVSVFLGFESEVCLSEFMESISAPSLREMCVAGSSWTTPEDSESLLRFLTQSSCTLDRLELGGHFDIIPLLTHRSCSLLTSLIIGVNGREDYFYYSADDEILRRLDLHRGDSLCPHLNLLGLRRVNGSYSVVQSMIESRICPQAWSPSQHERLQYFHLDQFTIPDFDRGRLVEVLDRSEMAYSLDWDNPRGTGSVSGWPQGEKYSQDIYCTGLRNWY